MVHVNDLADAYVRAAESSLNGQIFNVTDRSRFTILECAEAASGAAGKNGKTKTVPLTDATKAMGAFAECLTLNQNVDSSKAARLLGWQPRYRGFVDGVARYLVRGKLWRVIHLGYGYIFINCNCNSSRGCFETPSS